MVLYRIVAVFLLLAVGGQQVPKAPDLASLSDADLKDATIILERQGCYGTCPSYKLTIHGDGRVTYAGDKHVKIAGDQEGRIETAAFKALISDFARTNFLSIPHQYGVRDCACKRQCTDMPTAVTGLIVSGNKHHIEHYYGCGCAPKELFDLESAIDKAAHSEQWTGDVSKAGPYGTTCFEK